MSIVSGWSGPSLRGPRLADPLQQGDRTGRPPGRQVGPREPLVDLEERGVVLPEELPAGRGKLLPVGDRGRSAGRVQAPPGP